MTAKTKMTKTDSDAKALEAAHLLCDIDYPGEKVSDGFALRAYALKNENSKANPRVLLDACDGGDDDQFRLLLCSAGTHNYVIMEDGDEKLSLDGLPFDCESHEITPGCKDASSLFILFHRLVDYVVSADDSDPADITICKLAVDPETYGLEKLNDGKGYHRTPEELRKFVSDMGILESKYEIEISFDGCVDPNDLTESNVSNDDYAEDCTLCFVWANLLARVDFRDFDPTKLEESLQ